MCFTKANANTYKMPTRKTDFKSKACHHRRWCGTREVTSGLCLGRAEETLAEWSVLAFSGLERDRRLPAAWPPPRNGVSPPCVHTVCQSPAQPWQKGLSKAAEGLFSVELKQQFGAPPLTTPVHPQPPADTTVSGLGTRCFASDRPQEQGRLAGMCQRAKEPFRGKKVKWVSCG